MSKVGNPRLLLISAALAGMLGVVLGAFAAHGLKAQVSEQSLAVFQTGVHYQQWHALALLLTAGWLHLRPDPWLARAGRLFILGILLFSGSLYVLVLTDTPRLGMVTPVGGTALVAAWWCLLVAAWRWRG